MYPVFENGSCWVKVDFHLHTRADKEFRYAGEPDRYIREYVSSLKAAEVGVGVITNLGLPRDLLGISKFETDRERGCTLLRPVCLTWQLSTRSASGIISGRWLSLKRECTQINPGTRAVIRTYNQLFSVRITINDLLSKLLLPILVVPAQQLLRFSLKKTKILFILNHHPEKGGFRPLMIFI